MQNMKKGTWKRKFVVWGAMSLVGSLSAYVGSYASLVKPSGIWTETRRLGGPVMRAIKLDDLYDIPVPLPAGLSGDDVQKAAKRFFAPIHALDRRIRSEKWAASPMTAISDW
jgi:hypothetical protein